MSHAAIERALLASVFLAAVGCSSSAGPAKVGAQPSWRQSGASDAGSAEAPARDRGAGGMRESARVAQPSSATLPPPRPETPMVFAPPGPAVAEYNAPFEPYTPESPLYQAIATAIQGAARAAGEEPPILDPRLCRAADEMARVMPEDRPLSYAIIEFALHRQGIVEPSPHLVPVAGNLDEPTAMLEALSARLPSILADETVSRIGLGSARGDGPGQDVLVLLLQASHITTNRIPRELESNGRATIEGAISGEYREPAMFVTRDDGVVVRQELERRGKRGFRARFSCSGRAGKQQIEITAENERGAAVLANFPVWCGQRAPASVTVQASVDDLHPVTSEAEAEALMFRLLNRDRKKYGLPPLEYSAAVADVARAHSEEMRDTGVVAHVSATTGAAHDRVTRANISTSLVMENIARAYGAGEAQEGLMNSPGHRTNILSDKATHVGIGIAFRESEAEGRIMFFTQLFIRVPPALSPDQARDELYASIGRHPRRVVAANDLGSLAQAYAEQVVAANLPDAQAAAWRVVAFKPLEPRYDKVATAVVAVTDLETIDMDDAFSDRWITHYGLGVAQAPPGLGGEHGLLYVVLVLAQAAR